MYIEILIFGAVVAYVLNFTGVIKANRFIEDNQKYFYKLKEDDWDFFVKAKYGESVDPDVLFSNRLRNGFLGILISMFFFITNISAVTIVLILGAGAFMFKMDYISIKGYYKAHLHAIDSMLPYYLKGLEILIQHYTVPVAIAKSIDDAPMIFREGLRELTNSINAGNSTIEPYMEFARTYPVRDSMRMMRLLYRLGLGKQERKQEQLITFSKTISALQQKARDTRYAQRLEKMEGKTMSMLVSTGLGVMVLLIVAVLNMMNM